MAKTGTFQAELRALETVLNTLEPLDDRQRGFVLQTAAARLQLDGPTLGQGSDESARHVPAKPATSPDEHTPKEFLATKQPTTDVERVACLAYYLTHRRDQKLFKTRDISALNTEAAQPKFSNAAYAVKNATSQNNYLAAGGKGQKQITHLGEQVVEALPDRDAVRAAIDAAPKKRRKASRKKTATKKRSARKTADRKVSRKKTI